jgi:PAS domain-containing protein
MSYHRRQLSGEEARGPLRAADGDGAPETCGGLKSVRRLCPGGGGPATLNFVSDITQRRQAEEKLRESEERFRALFDNSQDCVYVIDLAGSFVDANRPLCNCGLRSRRNSIAQHFIAPR